ncbi:hypothetical protein CR513_48545, partial [Mucuna pruriens]
MRRDREKGRGRELRLPTSILEECSGTLSGFAGEQIQIRGIVELETTFGMGAGTQSMLVLYTMVDIWASYNMIIGCPALNRLEAVVSTHMYEVPCLKENRSRLGRPKGSLQDQRPDSTKELKEVKISSFAFHRTKIGITLGKEAKDQLRQLLVENKDVFAWYLADMSGIDTDFICHHLSTTSRAQPTCSKDPYSLLNIDRLVDGTSGFAVLSFMDTYSGYNQIRMHQQDEPNTTFITDFGNLLL